jgi:hypothetical protein
MSEELFYLQDTRQIVGNDMMWWAKDGMGYTTDISKAETYSKDRAFSQQESRETDKPWPKDYIDSRTRPVVDIQIVDYAVAMQEAQ